MRRGKLSVHISEVKKVLKNFAIEISAENVEDLKEATVTLKLQVMIWLIFRRLWVPTTTDKLPATRDSINRFASQKNKLFASIREQPRRVGNCNPMTIALHNSSTTSILSSKLVFLQTYINTYAQNCKCRFHMAFPTQSSSGNRHTVW